MASYLRPRRGLKATAEAQAIVLKRGEFFMEIQPNGITTGQGKSCGKIKVGDGTTPYAGLDYFIDVDTAVVNWENSFPTAESAKQGADLYQLLNNMNNTATVKGIFGTIKSLLYKLSTQVTQLNNDKDKGSKILLNNQSLESVLLRYEGEYNKKISNLPDGITNQLASQGAVVYNNEIHILSKSAGLFKWNGSSWEKLSDDVFHGGYQGRGLVYNNEIHYMSAYERGHYKWNGSSWSTASTDMPDSLYFHSSVVYNNTIHLFDGSNNHYKWNGSSWSKVGTIPIDNFYKAAAVVYNNEIHIFVGTKHYKYNGSSWTSVSTIPYSFGSGAAVVCNNEIHLLGSGTNHYKWNGSSWVKSNDVPGTGTYPAAVVYNNEIHMMYTSSSALKEHYILKKYYNLELTD